MSETVKELEIRQSMTAAYHPQTNGLTERFNKTLMEMLSMFVSSHQDDWDEYLPYVTHAYNTSVHASTNETPFFLDHAYDAMQPSFLDILSRSVDSDGDRIMDYKSDLMERMIKAREEVERYNHKIPDKRTQKANERRHDHSFRMGDLVWLYIKRRKPGLSMKMTNPHGGDHFEY
jgi:hypothetical protein